MRIDVITIFPKMFEPVLKESIIKRAQNKGKVKIAMTIRRTVAAMTDSMILRGFPTILSWS